ncbi:MULTISPECIES: tetratricopeptide repeat protein [unclassified Streptomyces]|uniref:tetratricopeptide repeat protein n=1 Tax=unclassified Streptomyces TaxID=2593676 RepID=UPI0036EB76B0
MRRLLVLLKPGQRQRPVLVAAVAGLAGVGKTELVLQTARCALKEPGWFSGGVLFRDLHGYDPGRRVPPDVTLDSLLRSLGIPSEDIPRDLDGRAAKYRSVLSTYAREGRRILVILDNAATFEQVQPLLPSDDSNTVLITSRHNLALGERLELNVLAPEAAVDLIRESLQDFQGASDARLDQDPDHAQQIAHLCGYLPLALQIAAALLADAPSRPLASLSHALSDVHHRLDQLRREDRAVRATLDLSYGQLSQPQASMFRLVAINPGPDLSTEAAAHLAATDPRYTEQLLEELARAHLIERGLVYGRWRLHDLVRIYAKERADEDAATADGVRRLLTYYLERAKQADDYLLDLTERTPSGFPDRTHALAWLEAERDNLLAAATLATTSRHTDIARDLPLALDEYLAMYGYREERRANAALAVRAAHALGDRRAQARAGVALSDALRELDALDEAITEARTAEEIFRSLGDQPGLGTALRALASALAGAGRHEESLLMSQQAVPLLRQGSSRHVAAVALMDYGVFLAGAERYDEAIDALQEALVVLSQTSRSVESLALRNLAAALDGVGRRSEAIDFLREAMARALEVGGRWETINAAEAAFFMGMLLEEDEQHHTASLSFQQAAELSKKTGDVGRAAEAFTVLGTSLIAQERHQEAADAIYEATLLTRSAAETSSDDLDPALAELLMILSIPLVKLRRLEDATNTLRETSAILRRLANQTPRTHDSDVAQTLHMLDRVLSHDDHDLLAALESAAEEIENHAAILRFYHLMETTQNRLGADHPETLSARHSLAWYRGQAGDSAGAAAAFARLLTDRERVLSPDHPHTLATRGSWAYWRGEAGDLAGAVAGLAELLDDQERVLGPEHPDVLVTRHDLAWYRGKAGDLAGAVAGFVELLADRERVLGPEHAHTVGARHDLAHWQSVARQEGDHRVG